MTAWTSPDRKKKNRRLLASFESAAVYSRNLLSKSNSSQPPCMALTTQLICFSGLETLTQNRRHSMFFLTVNLAELVACLEDLINYFTQPPDDMGTTECNETID